MKILKSLVIIGFISVLIVLAGCGEKKEETIKIGLPTVLSGDFAAGGQNIVDSAQLAIDGINEDGGVNGKHLQLIAEDAKFDSVSGLSAAQKLINIDGVNFIISGMSTNGILASAPTLNENKVVTLSAVTGGNNVDNAGDYIFRVANSDVLAGRDIADAMFRLGYERVGAVAETTEYTLDIKNSFVSTMEGLGGDVVLEEEFQSETKDFRTIITKMKEEGVEAVLVVSQTGMGGATFVKQSRELDFEALIFSDFTFVTNNAAREIVGDFEGIYFADPAYDIDDSRLGEFFDKYKNKYGEDPLIPFHSAAAYDSVQIFAKAIEEVGEDPEKVQEWISNNVKNYDGFMGTYSLDENGNSDIGFVIKVIKNGKFVVLER